MNLKTYLDGIERNPLGHLIASLPEEADLYKRARAQYEADARALWAVKVLDAWANKTGKAWSLSRSMNASEHEAFFARPDNAAYYATRGGPPAHAPVSWAVSEVDAREYEPLGGNLGDGPAPDAARLAAATALVAADPSLDPDGGK